MGKGREKNHQSSAVFIILPLKLHACALHKIIVKCNLDGVMEGNVRRN